MPTKQQIDEAEKIVKPSYNPALLTELHKKGDEDLLEMEEEAPIIEEDE